MKGMQQESDFGLIVKLASKKFYQVPSSKYHKLFFEEKKIVYEIHFGAPLPTFDSTNDFEISKHLDFHIMNSKSIISSMLSKVLSQ